MTRLRRLFRRPAAPSPASRAAFERATTDPFAEVAAATEEMRGLLIAPADTPGRIENIAASFAGFAGSMAAAVEAGDTRMIGFLERFLQDVDDRQRDRIGSLSRDIQSLALAFKEQQATLADLAQTLKYKVDADEARFTAIEARLPREDAP